MVVDIFAGSNTTGQVAESLGRRWISYDMDQQYVAASAFRFLDEPNEQAAQEVFERILEGEQIELA